MPVFLCIALIYVGRDPEEPRVLQNMSERFRIHSETKKATGPN
jgi:hypothetical protein